MLTSLSTTAALPLLGPDWLSADTMLDKAGPWALWVTIGIIFAECGLLLGFFLPGDTLLFTVGLFVSQGIIDHDIWLVCGLVSVAAIAGNVVGYEIGRAAGPPILERSHGKLIRQQHVERTQQFFDRWGPPAIVLARFVPLVRTFITVTAGVAQMNRRTYYLFSTLGGIFWVFSITLLGYWLGNVEFVKEHIQPHLQLVILAAVLATVAPILLHLLLEWRRGRRERQSVDDAV